MISTRKVLNKILICFCGIGFSCEQTMLNANYQHCESQSYYLYRKITNCDTITQPWATNNPNHREGQLDVNQLEVLIAVAREQSFSRAAQSLHRTQPAVSQAIRRLEAELGEIGRAHV